MMKRYNLEEFLNPERQKQYLKDQIRLKSSAPSSDKRVKKKKRHPHETLLLMKTIAKDIQRAEREGILERNGRIWKYHI